MSPSVRFKEGQLSRACSLVLNEECGQGLDTGFKSALGDKARTHVLWAEAVRALQDNVDEFHICHCVFMVTVYSHEQVALLPIIPLRRGFQSSSIDQHTNFSGHVKTPSLQPTFFVAYS